MLKRFGGWRLKLKGEELPVFYDPGYKCNMEVLCFDSGFVTPKFEPAVQDLQSLLEEQRSVEHRTLAPIPVDNLMQPLEMTQFQAA
jgi:hypothetical protein